MEVKRRKRKPTTLSQIEARPSDQGPASVLTAAEEDEDGKRCERMRARSGIAYERSARLSRAT